MKVQGKVNLTQFKTNNFNAQKSQNTPNRAVEYSVYNSSNPIGANYYNPSFGLSNPKAALLRAENVKQKYAQKGLNYLMPNEVWNEKKIYKVLDKVGQKFDELQTSRKLTSENLNLVLASLLPPAIAAKIKIKDFMELRKDLLNLGYTNQEAENIVRNYGGMTSSDKNGSTVYVPITNDALMFKNKCNLDVKATLEHELKHALTKNCTNIMNYDNYNKTNVPSPTLINETNFYNEIFMKFENVFRTLAEGDPVKLERETMVQYATNDNTGNMYETESELLADMNQEMNSIIKNTIEKFNKGEAALDTLEEYGYIDEKTIEKMAPNRVLTDEIVDMICKKNPKNVKHIKAIIKNYKLSEDAFSTKAFWEFMQHRAMDEKQAYRTESVFREMYKDKTQPLDYELQSLIYGEMEKFFRQKAKEVNS